MAKVRTAGRAANQGEKLAAATLALLVNSGALTREEAKAMSNKQIMALVEWDHYPVARSTARDLGWSDDAIHHATNLEMRLKAEHREKTAKKDIPAIAKSKRIAKDEEERRLAFQRILTKRNELMDELREKKRRAKIPSRGFAKGKRKLQSRSSFSRRTK